MSNVDEERLIKNFKNLVSIYSPSKKEGKVAEYIKDYAAKKHWDFTVDTANKATGGDTGNIICWLPGISDEYVLVSAHMDTVEPAANKKILIKDGIIRSDGTTILGADDESGIAIMLEMLEYFSSHRKPKVGIEAVFSISEEIGLLGAKNLDYSLIRSKYAYILDSGGPIGTAIVKAPSHFNVDVKIHGIASHAGAAPEKGVNAIKIAADAISRMKIGRIDEETTANVGIIQGGKATNIVPDLCEIKGEVRSLTKSKVERFTDEMIKCYKEAASKNGGRVDVNKYMAYQGYTLLKDFMTVKEFTRATKAIGLIPMFISSGGGSDANIYNQHGIEAIDVSTGMADVHTTHEHIKISDIVKLAELMIELYKNWKG